jgi:hypothetical protein
MLSFFHGIARCALAMSGEVTAAPPKTLRNLCRFMPAPGLGGDIVSAQTGTLEGARTGFVHPLSMAGSMSHMGHKRTNYRVPKSNFVRFGPKADKRGCVWNVR